MKFRLHHIVRHRTAPSFRLRRWLLLLTIAGIDSLPLSAVAQSKLTAREREQIIVCSPSVAALLPQTQRSTSPADHRRLTETATLGLDDAAENGNVGCATLLLRAGANVEGPFFADGALHNYSPLMKAVKRNDVAVAKLLLKAGANANLDWDGLTPLHEAALGDAGEAADLLLAHGARLNAVTAAHNFTALHTAISSCNLGVLKRLLAHGADVKAITRDGEGPLSIARRVKCQRVESLLRAKGAA